jgi:hypothetical protein
MGQQDARRAIDPPGSGPRQRAKVAPPGARPKVTGRSHHGGRALAVGLALLANAPVQRLPAQCAMTWPAGLGAGVPFVVHACTALPGGGFVTGGYFPYLMGNPSYVAAWKDGVWSPLGTGVQGGGLIGGVNSIVVLPDGDVVVGGHFQIAGGAAANHVARWDGQAWHPLGSGISGGYGYTWIDDMVVMPNGDLVVAGRFYAPHPWLARWNGVAWSSIGGGGWEGIGALALAPNGDLLCAYNQSPGARVMRWDGSAWTQVGSGSTQWRVYALATSAQGELLAGGQHPSVARWDGVQWVPVGTPAWTTAQVNVLEVLPSGDILAGGYFNQPGNSIARWSGAAWQAIGSGLQYQGTTAPHVDDIAMLADGRLVVGGGFDRANGAPASAVSLLSSSCPANASSYGTGCVGSAGAIVLSPLQWPLLGGVLRARTTGLTANSLSVGVFGFSQISVPLSSGHPLGLPGCDVLVADEILIDFMVGGGVVESSIAIPTDSYLVGATFHHQVVPVELDGSGSIQALTSSNGLTLTIGAY